MNLDLSTAPEARQGVDFAAPAVAANRRDFLKRLGGGLFIFVALRNLSFAQEAAREGARPANAQRNLPVDFNAYLRIGEDGRVTCYTGKIEMGQGTITSLPQMVAEELEVPLDSVDIVMGDTDLCPYDMGTWGSMSTRFFGPALRNAAAEAKAVLLLLGAESLGIPVSQLVASDGAIVDRQDSAHRITYGQLTKGQKIERHLTVTPTLKDVADFKVCGKPALRRDGRDKVTGKARYAADIRLPGMLYARILRPPAHGAKLTNVDVSPAKAVAGIQVIQDGDFVAVLHELPDVAWEAIGKVQARFEIPPATVDDKTIFDHLVRTASDAKVVIQSGDLAQGRAQAARSFNATYLNSYVAHAAMETHAALASIEGRKATVWASTQNPFGLRDQVAHTLGFPVENVRVITPYVGGGFGGKAFNLQAVEAARLARATDRPVQVMWSREEEFFYDTFRPAAVVKIDSGINAAGRITYWDYTVLYAGERGAPQFYTIPNHRTAAVGDFNGAAGAHPLAVGAWRAPGNNTNTFARESQIDLMAAAARIDPVEFRRQHLSDPRMIRVLKAAAENFGWTPGATPSHRGYGVACGSDAGSYVAIIAEVAVDPEKGTVRVKRVVCAQEMGVVINPEGAKIQMEGCITMGLGYALTEEVRFKGGAVLDTNFDSYSLPRFSWVPKIETVILEAKDIPPQGGGEPAIIVMGAVVANAVHDATGAWLRQLPMTPERVRAALPREALPGARDPVPG
jgi:isoquinoline 1-oxidoreductase